MPAVMEIACPKCQAGYKVSQKDSGKKLRCQKCGRVFVVQGQGLDSSTKKGSSTKRPKTSKSKTAKSKTSKSKTSKSKTSREGEPKKTAKSSSVKPKTAKTAKAAKPQSSRQKAGSERRTQSSKKKSVRDSGKQRQSSRQSATGSGRRTGSRRAAAEPEPAGSSRRRGQQSKKQNTAVLYGSVVGIIVMVGLLIFAIVKTGKSDKPEEQTTPQEASKNATKKGQKETAFTLPGSHKRKGRFDEKKPLGSNKKASNSTQEPSKPPEKSAPPKKQPPPPEKTSPPPKKPQEARKPAPKPPVEMVSKIPYPASLSRSRKEEHETLEEELLELEVSSQDGLRKKILKLSPKDAYIVLLNTFVGLNLGDEDQKGVGNFIHHLLSEVRGTEDGDPPVYDVFSEAPAGRNQCREDWFKWYRKKFQK